MVVARVEGSFLNYHLNLFILILYTGAGLFSLITEDGVADDIFVQVKKRFDEIRIRLGPLTPSSSFDEAVSSDDEIESPQLPPRKYKQSALQSLFARQRRSKDLGTSVERPPKPVTRKSQSRQIPPSSSYEEIAFDEEIPKKQASISPSFLNNLIQKHKTRARHTTSSSSSGSSDGGAREDNLYQVLSEDFSHKLPVEQNYSQVA